jgi:hypothetical protein
MQTEIQREITLLMGIDNVGGTEQVKILAICAKMLSCPDYFSEVIKAFDNIFSQPDFDIMVDIGRVVYQLVLLNGKFSFYKEISETRMKYVLYGVMYAFMLKHKTDWMNTQNLGSVRLVYCNAYDLILLKSDSIKIAKQGCLSCIGLTLGLSTAKKSIQ